jgi:hypothetical protein
MKRFTGFLAIVAVTASCAEGPTEPRQVAPDQPDAAAKADLAASLPQPDGFTLGSTGSYVDPSRHWWKDYGKAISLSDDACHYVPLDFTFTFYGRPYNGVWVNSNGNITFNGCFTSYSGTVIPRQGVIIAAPAFGDWNPSVSGQVYVNSTGSAGRRIFIATWLNIPEYSPHNSGKSSFQVQLHEANSVLLFSYWNMGTDGINWTAGDMSAGIAGSMYAYLRLGSGKQIPAWAGRSICMVGRTGDYRVYYDNVCSMYAALPR